MIESLYNYMNSELETPVYFVSADKDATAVRIVITPISDLRQYDTGLSRMRMQVSVWHTDKYAGIALREQVFDVLQRFKGIMGDTKIVAISHENATLLVEQDLSTEMYQYITDYFVTYKGD